MRLTKEEVVKAACIIADEEGMSALTLKAVAQRLGIRPPSLYNHVESLEALFHLAAHVGMEEMNRRVRDSAVGTAGKEALLSMAAEYFGYMIEHAGVYEVIQWATWHNDEKTAALFGEYLALIGSVFEKCGYYERDIAEITDIFSGFLHGYATMQLRYAFSDRENAMRRLKSAVDTLLIGIERKYHG